MGQSGGILSILTHLLTFRRFSSSIRCLKFYGKNEEMGMYAIIESGGKQYRIAEGNEAEDREESGECR